MKNMSGRETDTVDAPMKIGQACNANPPFYDAPHPLFLDRYTNGLSTGTSETG
jgi:hypothetical protein